MKNGIIVLAILGCFIIAAYLIYTKKTNRGINTIAIVTKQTQMSDMYIFFEQDTTIGEVEIKGGKFFFLANENPSIFFVRDQLKKGFIETYVRFDDGKIKEVEYATEMSIKNVPDSSYEVIGGSYRNIRTSYYKNGKKALNFIIFKAGFAKDIKSNLNLNISDSFVEKVYLKELINLNR